MTRLPFLVSVPHAGLAVPPEVEHLVAIGPEEVARDGDGQAAEIYLPLERRVAALVTTSMARAFVDVNRSEDDRSPDGAIKTQTCFEVPVYTEPPSEELVAELLARYHRPYHGRLSDLARHEACLGIDCHTMSEKAPPIAERHGEERPSICLSNAGVTCPDDWLNQLADCFQEAFSTSVTLNEPFRGGYIVRSHARELPWVQVELNRGDFAGVERKREGVLAALRAFAARIGA
jgi:N-formylglutamate amidohydrolase